MRCVLVKTAFLAMMCCLICTRRGNRRKGRGEGGGRGGHRGGGGGCGSYQHSPRQKNRAMMKVKNRERGGEETDRHGQTESEG